ncbi:LytTR family DNA-binding domain-containing protein [Sphingobacterium daejeonense]|uniref:LytR/AlgR family response regulator transcription factor n=1 Tax=Sphingobacterium daejeonense TaxID=371142 RepID=UPI0021A361B2|nr:LytTR family DNA-binding domain-containing protein [Sphingobacterium daejeonense]MCT1530753.1 LytTR family DNA-binding domain-containing protein [Sphingobacterium daejeonense]
MIKAIAIDDEPIALDIIRRYSERVPYINLEKQFLNGLEARDYLIENEVQLLFLDVRMPDINGIDLFKGLEEKPLVIFSTAYSEYALSGFELEALDYLLKPYSFERFEKACLRAKEMLELKGIIENNPTLFVKDGYQMVKIDLKEISVLQAVGNYLRFVMNGREVLARMTIKEFLSEWADNNFIQVHRSYVINTDKVSRLDRHVIWIDDIEIPIGGSFQDLVKEKFKL